MFSKVRRAMFGRLAAAILCFAGFGMLAAAPRRAAAQEVEPNEFIPLPTGTNVFLGYYVYGHNNSYNIAGGPTFKHDTGLEVNVAVARYVHFLPNIFGMPAGFQIIETFGSESAAQVGGQSLGSGFGAQNTALSAFLWPYSNLKTGTNVNLTGFIYPPDGTYDRNKAVNLGDNRLRGDTQIGLDQAIGNHFSTTLSFDTMFYGQNNDYTGFALHLNSTPSYRFQAWANWRWTKVFQSSVGYEGTFGGIESVDGTRDGNRTEEQRLRVTNSMFLSPRSQILLELNHDIENVGGFRQVFGVTGRFLYVF